MWSIDTPWFDVAVIMSIFAFGNAMFGRFEEHKPRGRRVLKILLVTAIATVIAQTAGRWWAYAALSVPLMLAAWIHLWWLPKHGINGWTAEPRDKYLELVTSRRRASNPRTADRE